MINFNRFSSCMDLEIRGTWKLLKIYTTKSNFDLDNLHFYRHGWASDLADIKPPHAKLICPTA